LHLFRFPQPTLQLFRVEQLPTELNEELNVQDLMSYENEPCQHQLQMLQQ
jgi:hypothetical protein